MILRSVARFSFTRTLPRHFAESSPSGDPAPRKRREETFSSLALISTFARFYPDFCPMIGRMCWFFEIGRDVEGIEVLRVLSRRIRGAGPPIGMERLFKDSMHPHVDQERKSR